MVKRELIKIGICAVIGLIVGIVMTVSNGYLQYVALMPFYAVGTFYGIRFIITMLGGIGKATGRSIFTSIAHGNFWGLLIIIILFSIALSLVLTFGWIIGIFVAAKALFDAYKTDLDISPQNDNEDSW